jgi:hypothetical protein
MDGRQEISGKGPEGRFERDRTGELLPAAAPEFPGVELFAEPLREGRSCHDLCADGQVLPLRGSKEIFRASGESARMPWVEVTWSIASNTSHTEEEIACHCAAGSPILTGAKPYNATPLLNLA